MTTELRFDLRGESGLSSEMLLWMAERAERRSWYYVFAGFLCLVLSVQLREPVELGALLFGLALAFVLGAGFAKRDSLRHAREAFEVAEANEAALEQAHAELTRGLRVVSR